VSIHPLEKCTNIFESIRAERKVFRMNQKLSTSAADVIVSVCLNPGTGSST
jgi:hypothetical protein